MSSEILKKYPIRIAVTGGAGFIGSNYLLKTVPFERKSYFLCLDALTYAGNLQNLESIANSANFQFQRVDLTDTQHTHDALTELQITHMIHFAAETHVDRSISGPAPFLQTNITGTFALLEWARQQASKGNRVRMLHVSTDEVYGDIPDSAEKSTEHSPFKPSSPYAASKAAADHLVQAYVRTYGLDLVTVRCSNNYGPYQFPEKLIPLVIRNAMSGLTIPMYGDGLQIRDWLHVNDHVDALQKVLFQGKNGDVYNIGSGRETTNKELIATILNLLSERLGGKYDKLVTSVNDRPGHDRRYAVDTAHILRELDWSPGISLEEGLADTIDWYLANGNWLEKCLSKEYQTYYEQQYGTSVQAAQN